MVDLRAMPFELDDEGVEWVESTQASLSLKQKIGQALHQYGGKP